MKSAGFFCPRANCYQLLRKTSALEENNLFLSFIISWHFVVQFCWLTFFISVVTAVCLFFIEVLQQPQQQLITHTTEWQTNQPDRIAPYVYFAECAIYAKLSLPPKSSFSMSYLNGWAVRSMLLRKLLINKSISLIADLRPEGRIANEMQVK